MMEFSCVSTKDRRNQRRRELYAQGTQKSKTGVNEDRRKRYIRRSQDTKDDYNERRRRLYSRHSRSNRDEALKRVRELQPTPFENLQYKSQQTIPVLDSRSGDVSLGSTSEFIGDNSSAHGNGLDSRRVRNKRKFIVPREAYVIPAMSSCVYCSAIRYRYEPEGFCCSKGQVRLQPTNAPRELLNLYRGSDELSVSFRQRVLPYNNMFAFTSFGVVLDPSCTKNNHGIYTFRAQGQVYHYMHNLYPSNGKPTYLQLYFYDTEREVDYRLGCLEGLESGVVKFLMDVLGSNPYSKFFRSLSEVSDIDLYQIRIRTDPISNDKTFSAPTTSQVAVIWKDGDDTSVLRERDILVERHDGHSVRIKHYYGCYDPLQYPLLFPLGEPGWHRGIKKNNIDKRGDSFTHGSLVPYNGTSIELLLRSESLACEEPYANEKMVSAREFYAYQFQIRPGMDSIILGSGRLLQQYVVDMYVKIETSRLDFFRHHQAEIRCDLYQGIMDSVARGESDGSQVGRRIILPGSFIGGPRDMRKRYLDAMALVEKFGRPDIFLTMTCNPNWVEIKGQLESHEQAQNRPDLVVRVFRSKFEQLKRVVLKKKLFGPVKAYTYVIEFQKRGLPHVHLLLILKQGAKIRDPYMVDQFISAEIPDEKDNPHLYTAVLKHMMHGPCGELNHDNVCMKSGKCRSRYPKKFNELTTLADDSFPVYKRVDDGRHAQVRGKALDNRWVVPYNPYLLSMFDCHINVEFCSTIKAVKYLYKYIYKGHDKIAFKIVSQQINESYDEITEYQSARWVTPQESMWRIYRYPLFEMSPSVIMLQLHLENCHVVPFQKTTSLDTITDSQYYSKTMLTQFFHMNAHNEKAKSCRLLYKDFPSAFVWAGRSRAWTERQHKSVIGRVITVNPSQGELYYLRLLLDNVPAPTSYAYLKTFGGVTYRSYKEAALARGFLVDDLSNEKCLEQARVYQMPSSLRQLFCIMLVFCDVTNPTRLFLKFEECLVDDFVKRQGMSRPVARQCLLRFAKSSVESMGKNLDDYGLLHLLDAEVHDHQECREILNEQEVNVSEIDLQNVSKLNPGQLNAYRSILDAVGGNKGVSFFVDGPGGTGKTFLYRALLATVRSGKNIALATATSGVAASILPNGRTAHSRFKIPVENDGALSCCVGKQSGLAKLLKLASLIIWDEASMAKRQNLESLDTLLRDVTGVDSLFGGKVIVFGGDFRQVLPVVPGGTREECVNASLVRSYIWPALRKYTLTDNMRARTDPWFSEYLLRVGNGQEEHDARGDIILPLSMILVTDKQNTSLDKLIKFVFPDFKMYLGDVMSMANSAILSPTNEAVDEVNAKLINEFPGREHIFLSIDEAINSDDQGMYMDFMHSISPPGFPPHRLVLKENCPVMMLRNLDPSKGLCNGTRLICRNFDRHVIVAQIAVGERRGETVFIPRIPLQPSNAKAYPVQFTRRQFPLRLCFAMTINKAQGQTLDIVGINLRQPVFAHGQLYVALSRATSSTKIKLILDPTRNNQTNMMRTKNVVYGEVLSEAHPMSIDVEPCRFVVSFISVFACINV